MDTQTREEKERFEELLDEVEAFIQDFVYVKKEHVIKFLGGDVETAGRVLHALTNRCRIYQVNEEYTPEKWPRKKTAYDYDMQKALWVFLDIRSKREVGSYVAAINGNILMSFEMGGELYDILCVHINEESSKSVDIFNQDRSIPLAINGKEIRNKMNRIVIIDDPKQKKNISIQNAVFVRVDSEGKVFAA